MLRVVGHLSWQVIVLLLRELQLREVRTPKWVEVVFKEGAELLLQRDSPRFGLSALLGTLLLFGRLLGKLFVHLVEEMLEVKCDRDVVQRWQL